MNIIISSNTNSKTRQNKQRNAKIVFWDRIDYRRRIHSGDFQIVIFERTQNNRIDCTGSSRRPPRCHQPPTPWLSSQSGACICLYWLSPHFSWLLIVFSTVFFFDRSLLFYSCDGFGRWGAGGVSRRHSLRLAVSISAGGKGIGLKST